MESYVIASISISVIIFIVNMVIYMRSKDERKTRYRCDGCGKVIEGDVIRITEKELSQPLDYCTQECKKKNLSMDRIKFGKSQE